MSQENTTQTSYTPEIRKRRGISPLWILPIVTMILAGWLVFKAVHDAGVRIQIHLKRARLNRRSNHHSLSRIGSGDGARHQTL